MSECHLPWLFWQWEMYRQLLLNWHPSNSWILYTDRLDIHQVCWFQHCKGKILVGFLQVNVEILMEDRYSSSHLPSICIQYKNTDKKKPHYETIAQKALQTFSLGCLFRISFNSTVFIDFMLIFFDTDGNSKNVMNKNHNES